MGKARAAELIITDYFPMSRFCAAFSGNNALLFQNGKFPLNSAFYHRHHHRHLCGGNGWILLYQIQYFLLSFSKFHHRHITDIITAILFVEGDFIWSIYLQSIWTNVPFQKFSFHPMVSLISN